MQLQSSLGLRLQTTLPAGDTEFVVAARIRKLLCVTSFSEFYMQAQLHVPQVTRTAHHLLDRDFVQ